MGRSQPQTLDAWQLEDGRRAALLLEGPALALEVEGAGIFRGPAVQIMAERQIRLLSAIHRESE